jgi:hypothetical protein
VIRVSRIDELHLLFIFISLISFVQNKWAMIGFNRAVGGFAMQVITTSYTSRCSSLQEASKPLERLFICNFKLE